MKIIKHEHSNGWYYVSVCGIRPFKFLMHGGWVYLNPRWLWRFLWVVPKERGWHWG
jgi:hypothetical protein